MGTRDTKMGRSGSRSPEKDDRRDRSRSRSRGRGGEGGRLKGTACRWNDRGFGFIKPQDGGEDLFCHVSSIEDGNYLREGDEVEYETTCDERKGKTHATKVTGGSTEDRRSGGGGYDDHRGGGGRYDDRDRYDDRRRYDDRDRRGGDRYDDRRGGDRYDDRRY